MTGLGLSGAKRPRGAKGKPFGQNNQMKFSKGSVRKIARRAGVKRMSMTIYDPLRAAARSFVDKIVDDAVTLTDYSKKKTVSAMACVTSLKRHGKNIYGF